MPNLKSQLEKLNAAYENYLDVLEQFAEVKAPLDEGNDWVDDLMLCAEDAEDALAEADQTEVDAALYDFVDIYEETGEWETPEALRQVEKAVEVLTSNGLGNPANMLRGFLGSYQQAVNDLLDQFDHLVQLVAADK